MSIQRINEFPVASGLTSDDIFLIMDDPSGSALTKKVSVSILHSGLVQSNTQTFLNMNKFKLGAFAQLPVKRGKRLIQ